MNYNDWNKAIDGNGSNDNNIDIEFQEVISNLIASLNHIGNNINQIAHILNIANVNNNLSEVDYETIINNLAVITNNISELG